MTWLETVIACVVAQAFCGSVIGLAIWFAQLRARTRKPALRTAPLTAPAANPLERADSIDSALEGLHKLTEDPAKFQKFFGAVDKIVAGIVPAARATKAVIVGAPGEDVQQAVMSGEIGVMCTHRGAAGLVNLLHEAAAEIELERPQLAVRLRRVRDVVLRGTSEFQQVQEKQGPLSGLEDSPHVN